MPKLTWINDAVLTTAVQALLDKAKAAKQRSIKEFGKNVIDPFSAVFEMSGFGMGYDDWVKAEEARQAQKTLQNFVGEFHQTILGSCKNWQNLHTGSIVDLVNTQSKIIAEIKNKFNTISGGKLADQYYLLEEAVMPKQSIYKGYTAYYVTIIPKKAIRTDFEFTPSDNKIGAPCPANKLIRQIDGASFYSLVTGDNDALFDLFTVLPDVIKGLTGTNNLDKKRLKQLFKIAYG